MRRSVLLFLSIAAFVIGGKILLEDVIGLNLEAAASAWLGRAGAGTAVLIAGLLAADVLLPVPSSLLMVLSGAAFGVLPGAGVALIGSVGGEWLGFELVRRYGRSFAVRLVGEDELARLDGFLARYGAAAVVVTRPLPIVMETMSVVAGLSSMRRATFLGASLAGTLPIVLIYAYAGAKSREVGNILPAAVILLTLAAAAWLVYRTRIVRDMHPAERTTRSL
jgi:uncharacterized membrane protein YdjX (TVP38/TMEM64 family)